VAENKAVGDVERIIEELTGVPPGGRRAGEVPRRMTRKEKHEQAERVKRFLALSPELQEGVLKYGEKIKEAYTKGS